MATNHTGGPSSTAYPAGQTHGSPERPMHQMARALLTFDLGAGVEQLRAEEGWQQGSRNAKTLVKHPDFRVVLIALEAGARMPEHKADQCITIQALSGRLRLHLPAETVELPAGALLALEQTVLHDVEALEESVFLLSLGWSRT